MAILDIRTFPDPILGRKAAPVGGVDSAVRRFLDDMAETMYESLGVGLAAPQVGDSRRIIVVDVTSGHEPAALIRLVDPVIVQGEGEEELEEGCLSIPEFTHKVRRFGRVTVRGLDPDGRERTIEAEGLLARALQHEIDHTDGILFVDRLLGLKREMVRRKLRKRAAERAE